MINVSLYTYNNSVISFKSYYKNGRLIRLLLDIGQSVLGEQGRAKIGNYKDLRGQDKGQQELGGSQSALKPILRFLVVQIRSEDPFCLTKIFLIRTHLRGKSLETQILSKK